MSGFETHGAEAAHCVPAQASSLRRGGYVLIRDKPCKIVEMSSSKVGKHGHAKVHLVGLDVFDNKKHEVNCPSSHNMSAPNVKKQELEITFLSQDGYFSLMTDKGVLKSDVKYNGDVCSQSLQEIRDMVEYCEKGDYEHACVAQLITCMDREAVKEVRKVKATSLN